MDNQLTLEYAVLGDVLTGGASDILPLIEDLSLFYNKKCQKLTELALEMHKQGKIVDLVTVDHEIQSRGLSGDLNRSLLADVTDKMQTRAHTLTYINILKKNAHLRAIQRELGRISPDAKAEDIDKLMQLIQMRDNLDKKNVVSPVDFIDEYISDLMTRKCLGIETGYMTLDHNLYSQQGDLVVIGARTNIGKTVFLTNILVNILNEGVPCLYSATEMRPKQYLDRLIPLIGSVSAYNMRSRNFSDSELKELPSLGMDIAKFPLKMLDIAGPSVQEIEQAVKASGCKVLFIDYLGRCDMPQEKTRMREIERFVVSVKNICVKHEILCFMAVQLSRESERNKDTEPRLSDLSDSSAIEKEADAVVLLWKNPELNTGNDIAISAILSKNRHGPLSNWIMDFDKKRLKMTERGEVFSNYTETKEVPII